MFRLSWRMGKAAAATATLSAVHPWVFRPQSLPALCTDDQPVRRASTMGRQTLATQKSTALYKAYESRYGTAKAVQLTYRDVRQLLSEIGIHNEYLASRIFFVMDSDGSGTVDFKEMALFCRSLSKGTPQEKAKFVFKACDMNSNGLIEKDDIRNLVKSLCLVCHEVVPTYSMVKTEREAELYADLHGDVLAQVVANRIVADMFATADTDKSGSIDLKEFMFWVTRGGKTWNELCELFPVLETLTKEA